MSRILEQESVPFIALDNDPRRISEATIAGESVVYGDAARREVLIAAGLMRAKVLVVSYADTVSALKILAHVQALRPELSVVVTIQTLTCSKKPGQLKLLPKLWKAV